MKIIFKSDKLIQLRNHILKNSYKKVTALLMAFACCLSCFLPAAAANESTLDYSSVFDPSYYYNTYPDLQQSIGNDPSALLKHFTTIGMKEGRNGSSAFQIKAYMQNNLDLLPVYGVKDLSKYYLHYISAGRQEGRVAVFKKGAALPEGVLSSYSTTYDTTEDRAVNVELAAARINGMVIKPGEKFSFSNSIGTRTIANGYVVAPSFASGRVVSSVGGGICQVSSTIYVAMLLAYIAPTQRYTHSLPVSYVPAGLDAAIVEGYKDLTFTNNFDYSIVINATTQNGVLTVSFLKQAEQVQ